ALVREKGKAQAVTIGNPNIASVSAINMSTIAVTGKGVGRTNLILFDENGETVLEVDIQVGDEIKVYSAQSTTTILCAHSCSQGSGEEVNPRSPPTSQPPRVGDEALVIYRAPAPAR